MLTRQVMVQALADRLAGFESTLKARQFTGIYRKCWEALDAAGPEGRAPTVLMEVLAGNEERDAIIGAILGAAPGSVMRYESLEDLAPDLQPVQWLWTDWIPRGMLTLMGAVPGAGKSFVALDLARRIIEGSTFPDGTPVGPGRPVIYVDAEAIPQVIKERAENWQMNKSKLFLMLPDEDLLLDLSTLRDQERLVNMVYTIGPALVVVDSLSSVSTKGENNIEDIRELLAFLNRLAVDYECGLLMIHHLRKRGTQQTMLWDGVSIDDFRGSGHIIAMARSVMGLSVVQIGAEPDKNGPRKLEIVKTNLTRYPDPLGVEFQPLHPKGVRLAWGEAPVTFKEPTKMDECKAWLEMTLKASGEPMKPKEIVEAAEAAGFSRKTVYRAREELRASIQNTEGRKNKENAWLWDDEESGEDED